MVLVTGTQTVDLAAWLTAIWDEEEAAVLAVPDAYRTWEIRNDWVSGIGLDIGTTQAPGYIEPEHARFIAANDPASVLARIAADRKILELHKIDVRKIDHPPFDELTGERWPDAYDVICRVCGWAAEDPSSACETVRLLASPYKGREGWQEGWTHE